MNTTKTIASAAALGAFGLLAASSASAALLFYEPFAYASGALNGQGGWTAYSPSAGAFQVIQEGTTSGIIANNAVDANPFDGTYSNLAHSGGYVGGLPSPPTGGGNNPDHVEIYHSLPFTGFADGTTTWFSYVNARSYSNNARSPSFALGASTLGEDRGNNAFGEAIGVGGRNNAGTIIFPQYWDQAVGSPGEVEATITANYGGGPFLQQSYWGDGTTAIPAGQFFTWNSGSGTNPGPDYGRAQIIVGRIDWNPNGTPDVITVARFNDDEVLTEAEFAARAISSSDFLGPQPDLDNSQFDTVSIGGGRYFADEIRIGTTAFDVGLIPEPSTALLSLLGFGFLLRRRRS